MTSTTYYHVAGPNWTPGDDLVCWDILAEHGLVTEADWKWDDAPLGYDGNLVCVFEDLGEARLYQQQFGGTLLAIEPNDDMRIHRNEDGYLAINYRIPAYAITIIA